MPLRVVRFALRHSGRFLGRIRCWLKGHCEWQEVGFGDDDGMHKGRICVCCKREEMVEEAEDKNGLAPEDKLDCPKGP